LKKALKDKLVVTQEVYALLRADKENQDGISDYLFGLIKNKEIDSHTFQAILSLICRWSYDQGYYDNDKADKFDW
jgi:hypothetical protein